VIADPPHAQEQRMSTTAHLVCPPRRVRLGLGAPLRRPDGTVQGFTGRPEPDFARALWRLIDDCEAGGLALALGSDAGAAGYREIGGSPQEGGIPFSEYLDDTDRDRITYYALLFDGFTREHPSGLVRRRHRDVGLPVDEAFTRNDRWEPSEYLVRYQLGHNDIDHVEISEGEATAFVLTALAETLGGGDPQRP
jgi:hypothetical protein